MRLFICGMLCGLMGAQMAVAGAGGERLQIGKYQSRAIWQSAIEAKGQRRPAVILIPGSGANGPEEMMPGKLTGDGKDHSIFAEFAEPLNHAGLHTLALGKPGIEFFSKWDNAVFFYNLDMFKNARWSDYTANVVEAIHYLRSRADVDADHIYLLGHSEGTQVAVDVAKLEPGVKGLILLGFLGDDMASTLDWQLFRRPLEKWIIPDVDTDHDGFITRAEAAKWPEFKYPWKTGQEKVSYAEIEAALRADPATLAILGSFKKAPLYKEPYSAPIYDKAVALPQDLFVFTGALDVQTRPENAEKMRATCERAGKKNCAVTIVPGVGHGFSPPRPPRQQVLLDLTIGPVSPEFQTVLHDLGSRLAKAK